MEPTAKQSQAPLSTPIKRRRMLILGACIALAILLKLIVTFSAPGPQRELIDALQTRDNAAVVEFVDSHPQEDLNKLFDGSYDANAAGACAKYAVANSSSAKWIESYNWEIQDTKSEDTIRTGLQEGLAEIKSALRGF